MSEPNGEDLSNKRLNAVLVIFLGMLLVVSFRLFWLQVIRYDFFKSRSIEQRTRIIIISADRGDIFDRVGSVLATSIDTSSIFASSAKISREADVAALLSGPLGESKYSILKTLRSTNGFVWIKRKVPVAVGEKVRALKIDGVGVLSEKKRLYTKGSMASQVLGFVGLDNTGMSGLELGLEKYLMGVEGRLVTESDPSGRELFSVNPREVQAPTRGMAVTLAIDEVIQYFAEGALRKAVRKHGAVSGTLIVMDVENGDILAIASEPDFDPNRYKEYSSALWDSRALLDVYEPGSTFKLITVASALEDGVIKENDIIHCPDSMKVGGKIIENSHKPKNKYCSLDVILAESINTGVANISIKLGEEKFFKYIRAFGFGERTRIGVPGETPGILRDVKDWSKSDIATIAFGQGIAVTPLQMLSSVVTIANKGVRLKPILVKKIEGFDGSSVKVFPKVELGRVLSERTSKDVMRMMVEVVEKGTGRLAKIKGFSVGGKTGTAEKVRPGGFGYWPGHYVASFVGVAPASRPKIAAIVIIDDPLGVFWGERLAAPVFARVVEDTLRYLNVAPDEI